MLVLLCSLLLKTFHNESKKISTSDLKDETDFLITDCLFHGIKDHSLYFNSKINKNYEVTINMTTFVSCSDANAPAIYLNLQVHIIFQFVCILNCTATQKWAIFYVETTRDESVHSISYLTAHLSQSKSQSLYFKYNKASKNADISFTNCNISNCQAKNDLQNAFGVIYLENLLTKVKYTNIDGNTGTYSILYMKSTSDTSQGNIQYCNIINNNEQKRCLIEINGPNLDITESVFKNNSTPVSFLPTKGKITVRECHYDSDFGTTFPLDYEGTYVIESNYRDSSNPFEHTFFENNFCKAEIPYIDDNIEETSYESDIDETSSNELSSSEETSYESDIDEAKSNLNSFHEHNSEKSPIEVMTSDENTDSYIISFYEESVLSSEYDSEEDVNEKLENITNKESSYNENQNDEKISNDNGNAPSSQKLMIIIGMIVGAIVIVIIIIAFLLYKKYKNNSEASQSETEEMEEEVLNISHKDVALETISIFTTTIVSDSDPFAADFEESDDKLILF